MKPELTIGVFWNITGIDLVQQWVSLIRLLVFLPKHTKAITQHRTKAAHRFWKTNRGENVGHLRYYGMESKRTITIATGFREDPTNPKLTSDFNLYPSQSLTPLNFYDVIKKKTP